jgi:hypothetical protein
MRATEDRGPRAKPRVPLRIHVLDGADELPNAVPEMMSALVAALAPLEPVVVVALNHDGRVTMYRQAEWLPAGVAQVRRLR